MLLQHEGILVALVRWFVSAFALMVTAYVVPGFRVRSFGAALIAALVIGLANIFVWPFLFFVTLPLNILTLGLFTFVIDAIVLKACAAILRDFEIMRWSSAIIGAFVLAVVSALLHFLLV